MSQFIHRLFTTVLSVVLFSAVLAGVQYTFFGGDQLGFGLLLGIYSFYTAPVFILGGIPAAYLVDFYLKNRKELNTKLGNYLQSFALYGIAGITVAMVYSAISGISAGNYFFTITESIQSVLIGLGAAIVYYHIALLLQINWEKLKKQYEQEQQQQGAR
ncbi:MULTISPECIES: hypothetical protein [Bacillaceae]|uniref:DUF2975 domain-containing protein n=1 Tax=Evansella alkalicola TaxID=745819 RepID=A0ABS6JYU7_9BACI|nr:MULTISPECIES: hypothetical protein [Bacillaceae]MBU9722834.1 hypothetical protein [Bacillus alkalicola]